MTTHNAFASLQLPVALLETLSQLGYEQLTPIQQQSLPALLAGQDVTAKAKTGSGKTAAFAIGLIQRLTQRDFGCQALVLCPTRELATQVAVEIRRLARYQQNIKVVTLCGGQPIGPQIASLEHGAHVVVGTPGRIQDHLRKGTLVLNKVKTLVLDEADRMLDMGFVEAIEGIIAELPKGRQTCLFSATYPDCIAKLSRRFQKDPVTISVESTESHSRIKQLFYQAEAHDKSNVLIKLLQHYAPVSTVIFCNTKQTCKDVGSALYEAGYKPVVLHGDLEQRDRDQMLIRFANQSATILIATDVAARGLDIENLALVVNYNLSRESKVHVHRIGRTGRAGREGLALSLFADSERYKLDRLEVYMGQQIEFGRVDALKVNQHSPQAPMVTLAIDGGRKHKMRPGDILGALTGEYGIKGDQAGKIHIFDFVAYVAVRRDSARQALSCLEQGRIKGRKFKVRRL